jgi:hypothetical protein
VAILFVLRVMSRLGSWNLMILYVIFITQFTTTKRLVKQGWCHTFALPFTLKKYPKAKERRIMETQIFHHAKI